MTRHIYIAQHSFIARPSQKDSKLGVTFVILAPIGVMRVMEEMERMGAVVVTTGETAMKTPWAFSRVLDCEGTLLCMPHCL